MNATRISRSLMRITRREEGSSTIELAIVFPLLLALFVGAAELGRLFFTYTTLSKATWVGARFLSTSRNAVNGTATDKTNALNTAKNLVVCGSTSTDPNDCTGKTPVIPGLTTANVLICDNFSTPCSPVLAGAPVKYFRVEIQNFTYSRGVFNLAGATGGSSNAIYFPLKPGTETRWMQ